MIDKKKKNVSEFNSRAFKVYVKHKENEHSV